MLELQTTLARLQSKCRSAQDDSLQFPRPIPVKLVSGALVCLMLTACMPENARELSVAQSEDGGDQIAFTAPDFLNTQMIDQSQLVPELELDGDPVTLQRDGLRKDAHAGKL